MDKIDPICGMEGTIRSHGHYFCSQGCVDKYEKGMEHSKTCCGHRAPWYKDRLLILTTITIALFFGSLFFYRPLFDSLWEYLRLIWWAILLGLLLGGVIDHYIPTEYVQKLFSTHRKREIFIAVLFGFLMSACSHGILAIAMQLYKKGASTASTIAFLMAAPWANLPITVLFFGFFGMKALLIVFSAILIAIITGFIFQLLESKGMVECANCKLKKKAAGFSIRADLKKRWKSYNVSIPGLKKDLVGVMKGSWTLSRMILWWILIGMIIASFARTFVPQHFFMAYMGATLLGMLAVLALATVIEVCSEGSAPMAFEIFTQTGAFGNSFVFLMAGVATDYTEIGLIWSNIGKRAAIWLPIVAVPQIIALGFLFNMFL